MANGVHENTGSAATQAPVRSAFADDPDFAELVEFFVESMPERQEALKSAYQSADFDSLRVIAHQLKGAGGGYGFDGVSERSAALEHACNDGGPHEILPHVQNLINYLNRVSA